VFPAKFWSKRSDELIDFIEISLIKNPEERIKIDGFLKHKWIRSLGLKVF
jgi:hypothetical protein